MKKGRLILVLVGVFILLSSCSSPKSYDLLTWEEYSEIQLSGPYILELERGEGSLLYYGVTHTTDPADPQLADIERQWDRFKPDLAYAEGGNWPLEDSREKAVRKGGEQGLLRFLAARDKVRFLNIDPPGKDQLHYLLNNFPGAQVKVYYILLHAVLRRTRAQERPNSDIIHKILRELSTDAWIYKGPPRTLKEFEEYLYKYFPGLGQWQDISSSYFNSSDPDNFLATIHRAFNSYRDQVMVGKIVRSVKQGKRVFALVGRSHVVVQEPALRTELGLQTQTGRTRSGDRFFIH